MYESIFAMNVKIVYSVRILRETLQLAFGIETIKRH